MAENSNKRHQYEHTHLMMIIVYTEKKVNQEKI